MSEHNLFMKHPSKADAKCLECHGKSDNLKQMTPEWVVHHSNIKPESERSCAGCHREHQGRDSSIVRLTDNDCTSCHKDLKDRVKSGEKVIFANTVKDFATHPEFGTYSGGVKNPETLKFNHKLHLTPGQGSGYRLGKIRDEDKAAYDRFKQKGQSDNDLVQLDCTSCHVPQSGGHGASASAGRYMQPIQYETNCRACHPLTFDDRVKRDGKLVAVAHGQPLSDTKQFIEIAYITAMRQDEKAFSGWNRPAGLRRQEDAQSLATKATNYLRGNAGCGECHTITGDAIVPVNIPDVWFKHAKFSHAAHSTMKCADCHGKAPDSTVNTDVLLPDAKSCKSCHGATRPEPGKQAVRSECTTCHTYHHGPESNPGAAMRGRDLGFAADWRRLMRK